MDLVSTSFVVPYAQPELGGEEGLTSLDISKALGVRHHDVLRSIASIASFLGSTDTPFIKTTLKDSLGRTVRVFVMMTAWAKVVVAQYKSKIGIGYTRYLIASDDARKTAEKQLREANIRLREYDEEFARLRNENQTLAETQKSLPKPKREKRQRVPVIHGDLLGGITLNFQVMDRSQLVDWQKIIAQVPTMAHVRDKFEKSIRERVDIAVKTLRNHLGPIGIDVDEVELVLRQAIIIMCKPKPELTE